MDWADDVAYSVHDVEDALVAGHLDIRALPGAGALGDPEGLLEHRGGLRRRRRRRRARRGHRPAHGPAVLARGVRRFAARPRRAEEPHLAAHRPVLHRRGDARPAPRYGDGRLTRYAADLVVPREQRLEVAVLKAVANRWVMQRAGAESVYAGQRELVQELVAALRLRGAGVARPRAALGVRRGDRRRRSAARRGRPGRAPHRPLGGRLARPALPLSGGSAAAGGADGAACARRASLESTARSRTPPRTRPGSRAAIPAREERAGRVAPQQGRQRRPTDSDRDHRAGRPDRAHSAALAIERNERRESSDLLERVERPGLRELSARDPPGLLDARRSWRSSVQRGWRGRRRRPARRCRSRRCRRGGSPAPAGDALGVEVAHGVGRGASRLTLTPAALMRRTTSAASWPSTEKTHDAGAHGAAVAHDDARAARRGRRGSGRRAR